MLGRLRMSIQETIDRWMIVVKPFISHDSSRGASRKGVTTALETKRFEEALQDLIGEDWESKPFQDEGSLVDAGKVYVDPLPYRQLFLP